jgi:hypothetical protein
MALVIRYLPVIHTYQPYILEEGSMFMNAIPSLLSVNRQREVLYTMKLMTADCKKLAASTSSPSPDSDSDEGSGEDMGLADTCQSLNPQDRMAQSKDYRKWTINDNSGQTLTCSEHATLPLHAFMHAIPSLLTVESTQKDA